MYIKVIYELHIVNLGKLINLITHCLISSITPVSNQYLIGYLFNVILHYISKQLITKS